MSNAFSGQTALITGAASGIGRATAEFLAQQGATVIVADRNVPEIETTVRDIVAQGGKATGQPLDVTVESDWDRAIEEIVRNDGRLDILVNSAGIALVKPVADMSIEEWDRVLKVNLDGVFLGTRAAIRAMRRGQGGSIVNVASASGIKAAATSSAYCASKAAVIMLTKVAALECAQELPRIRINAVAPGGVKTPMWSNTPGVSGLVGSDMWNVGLDAPIGKRFAEPIEIARVIAFLASAEASYMTGGVIPVDAGYTA